LRRKRFTEEATLAGSAIPTQAPPAVPAPVQSGIAGTNIPTPAAPQAPAGAPPGATSTPDQQRLEADPAIAEIRQQAPDAQITPSGRALTVQAGDKSVDVTPVQVLRGTVGSYELSYADLSKLQQAGPDAFMAAAEKLQELNNALAKGRYTTPETSVEEKADLLRAQAEFLKAQGTIGKQFTKGANIKSYGPGGFPTGQEIPTVINQFTGEIIQGGAPPATTATGERAPQDGDVRVMRDPGSGQQVEQVFVAGEWVNK
jgi:hypothetical protein